MAGAQGWARPAESGLNIGVLRRTSPAYSNPALTLEVCYK
jgi:hypothetical protein